MLNISSRLPVPRFFPGAPLAHVLATAALLLGFASAGVQRDTQGIQYPFIGDLDSYFNREVLWMSVPAIILSILIFIGTSWALFYTVAKFRERKGDTREPAQFHGNHTLEIVLIAVPFLIVTVLAILTVRSMARLTQPDEIAKLNPGPPIVTKVVGAQFWWNFSYPQLGGFTNGNEMVIPAGPSVKLEMEARDVIHAFWAPNIGGQRSLIPGSPTDYTLGAISQPGVYQGNCTQLCGASHANMRYKVIALEPQDWETFVAAARAYEAPVPDTPLEELGQRIFFEGVNGAPSCASCHRIQGTEASGQAGPDMSFYGTRRTLGAGMWEGETAIKVLPEWILNCPAVKPGCLMPPYVAEEQDPDTGEVRQRPLMSERELAAVEAYILSLRLPEEADYWRLVLNDDQDE